ncbi:hypothetical protein GCM10020295_11940 [Streptomyces cinereospinus]
MPVVGGDLAAQVPQHGDAPGVEAGRHQHGSRGCGQRGDRPFEALRHVVRVGAEAQDVVAAGAEGDQVRREFGGPWHLLGHDLVEQPAAYGEIGVLEVALGSAVREQYGEPVGPADERPAGAGVADALGEAVPHRHVRPDH